MFTGLNACEKVLRNRNEWRYIYAMLIGYARVSTSEQDTAAQVAALKAGGCERLYREKASGGRWDRPELHRLLDQLRKGDVLVVWKLDRLSRSLRDVLTLMERLGEAKAGFRSLTEAIDTTTPAGRMLMQMVGAFAEFERAMLRERTKAGLESARQDGRVGGRRPKLTPQQQAEITRMVAKGDKTAADAARLFKIHPATVSRLLSRANHEDSPASKRITRVVVGLRHRGAASR
jgi:DNA invertase Pin-like site-specific DNA recombinase